nr:transposase [Caldicellulosiruptor changbaiensis]
MINRGLKREFLIIVSDDFPGIIETFKAVYPHADHQLCFVHVIVNTFSPLLIIFFPHLF